MRILVPVKEVAMVEEEVEIADNAILEKYLDYDLNEWDDYAVEAAVQARENGVADEVIAVTIGPERCEETIRIVLAKGADRAIRVWDESLAERDLLDVSEKTRILEAVVEQVAPDLVLTGVQAHDDGWGATGVSLAETVDFGWAAVVNRLELEEGAASATVRRELEGSVEERTDVDLPAVLTVQTGLNQPRYASLRGIRKAQQKEIAHWTLDDLDRPTDDTGHGVRLTDMYEPETDTETTYFEGDADREAAELATVLREAGVAE